MTSDMLNLARKWRSKNFDQIVGQELSIRLLKNSLFKNYLFPVYLFSGQRGCGKTTTARVFAAAINCREFSSFQKNPHQQALPCLVCESCVAFSQMKHPDFIEIDAASHTGVEHVRELIDAASFLPVSGRKRIYLIDEAHMLSKAAFNALLKILEEPPRGALFILATTDMQKIIDTVRSRCFQLFFDPVNPLTLRSYLETICEQESITCDEASLDIIVRESSGCVRDALNLVDQVRCSTNGTIDSDAVLATVGGISDDVLLELIEAVVAERADHLTKLFDNIKLSGRSIEYVWRRILDMMRALLWIKNGATASLTHRSEDRLKRLAKQCSLKRLCLLFDRMANFQQTLHKVAYQPSFFEAFFITLCGYRKGEQTGNRGGGAGAASMPPAPCPEEALYDDEEIDEDEYEEDEDEVGDDEETKSSCTATATRDQRWQDFMAHVQKLDDPLIASIFSQVVDLQCHHDSNHVDLIFPQQCEFFLELIEQTKPIWRRLFEEYFGKKSILQAVFTAQLKKMVQPVIKASENRAMMEHPKPKIVAKATVYSFEQKQVSNSFATTRKKVTPLDVSNANRWPIAHQVLKYFPGTVTADQG